MIVEWLFSLGGDLAVWVLGFMPPFDDKGVFFTVDNWSRPLVQGMASMGAFVDWATLAVLMQSVTGYYIAMLTLRCLRALLGHVPFVGGNG